jgi:DNA-binding response OmpR family regulator
MTQGDAAVAGPALGRMLVVRGGSEDGRRIVLGAGITTIGRLADNVISVADGLLSRRHAVITYDGRQHLAEDLGSMNGTFVNGERIPPRQPQPLCHRDVITAGALVLVCDFDGETMPVPCLQLDAAAARVWVHGQQIRIVGRPYLALQLLNGKRGNVATKDELAAALWPRADGAVADHAIEQTISRLRLLLGDKPRAAGHIVTVPGVGYRLEASHAWPDGRVPTR